MTQIVRDPRPSTSPLAGGSCLAKLVAADGEILRCEIRRNRRDARKAAKEFHREHLKAAAAAAEEQDK